MVRQKVLLFFGLLAIAVSVYAAVAYGQAFDTSFRIPALMIVAIAGAAAVTSGYFKGRMNRFTEAGRSSEKLLRDSESRFRQLFDISPFPATVTSLKDNRVLAINQRTADRFRIPQSEAVGMYAPDFYVNPAQRETIVGQLKKQGLAEGLLIELKTPSGERFWADVSARVVTFEGEPATLAVFHDVTERVAAEQTMRASEQRLAAENKALTDLTARQARGSSGFEDDLRDLLETGAGALGVARISMWGFVMERTAIQCLDLYEQQRGHSTGQVLLRSDYRTYFEALEQKA